MDRQPREDFGFWGTNVKKKKKKKQPKKGGGKITRDHVSDAILGTPGGSGGLCGGLFDMCTIL